MRSIGYFHWQRGKLPCILDFILHTIRFLRDNPCVFCPFKRGAEAQAGLCEDNSNDRIKRGGGVGGEGVALILRKRIQHLRQPPSPVKL